MPFNFLEEADAELIASLKAEGRVISYGPGKKLLEEGIVSGHVLILLDGEVSINTTDHQGNQQCLARLSDGAMVGEMSWLEKRPAVADVVTTTKCTVLELDVIVLDNLRERKPITAAVWQRLVAKKTGQPNSKPKCLDPSL